MNRTDFRSLLHWTGLYFRNVFACAPRKSDAAPRVAGISDERMRRFEKLTGFFFIKPIRKFFGFKPMPEHMARFIEADEKYHRNGAIARREPAAPPPAATPAPPAVPRSQPGTWRV
jgi:hypothetical protein